MSLTRVTLDDLRHLPKPERAPLAERWVQVREYAEHLTETGQISQDTKRRMLQTVGRWLILELVASRLEQPTQDFNRKLVRYLGRVSRKLA